MFVGEIATITDVNLFADDGMCHVIGMTCKAETLIYSFICKDLLRINWNGKQEKHLELILVQELPSNLKLIKFKGNAFKSFDRFSTDYLSLLCKVGQKFQCMNHHKVKSNFKHNIYSVRIIISLSFYITSSWKTS